MTAVSRDVRACVRVCVQTGAVADSVADEAVTTATLASRQVTDAVLVQARTGAA